MSTPLSPHRLAKARDVFNSYNVLTTLSWCFLVGNIITLFALKLNASATYIGLLNAILYISFFFLPLGKLLTRRFTIIGIFSTALIVRAIGMTPVLIAPLVVYAGKGDLALKLVLLGVSIFHVARGIGMVGNNPVIGLLASGPDRGSYLTQIQITSNAVGMFAGFLIAILLGRDPPFFLYTIIFAAGLCSGVASGFLLRKVPDPGVAEGGKGIKLVDIIKQAISTGPLRRFMGILLLVALVSGVSRIFLIVYSREVFLQSDGMVSFYAVFAGLGVLMIGLLVKFLVDRIGAKPIFMICVIIGVASVIPIIISPRGMSETTVFFFLTILFFFMNFGFCGAEGIAQTYFFGLVPGELMLDMGILYFLCFGIAGTAGSFLGGVFLDLLKSMGLAPFWAFRILYILLFALGVVILFLQRKMVPLGALPFRDALEVMFSYRDLHAISLLERLNKTQDSGEEEALLEALHGTPSKLAIKGLLARAKSPRFMIRMESIRAIDALTALNEDAERALMEDILTNPYTTAYLSARTLGNHGAFRSIFLLREVVTSNDYMLASEAIVALAKLGDHAFRPHIENIIMENQNPRLKIMGVEAFGIYGSPDSLSVLLGIMKDTDPLHYLRDTVVLSMASILDIQNQFYPLLVRFLSDESLGPTLALDEAEAAYEYYVSVHGRKRDREPARAGINRHAKDFQPSVLNYVNNSNGIPLARWILELPDELVHTVTRIVLSEILLDDEYLGFTRLRLLIVHWAAHELRLWARKQKD